MALILIPLPRQGFDPTEAGVPWQALARKGHQVCFATPDGCAARADPRVLTGAGFGPWRSLLRADRNGRAAHDAMVADAGFLSPMTHAEAASRPFDGLILPGGHAPGMREYLESDVLQRIVVRAFEQDIPVGAICHGVVLAARSRGADGRSILHGRRTTALIRTLELSAWALTALWLGNYYRTYPQTVEAEVTRALAQPCDFERGPLALRRDDERHPERGFTVRDGNYLSARWPGDAHRFATEFLELLDATRAAEDLPA
ncbi:MAG: DJ-1/PfpI family protein [Dokdonella sp.]|nr:DJ-1/PfpI family protein [Dokdonella sp.]MCB1578170.1 DJ-1/PfpI family protein [Xanthomonadales bacterium]